MVNISKSIMNTYQTCPQRYKLLYIDRIETETSEAAQRGKDFHKFAEEYYNNVSSGSNGELIVNPRFVVDSLERCIPDAKQYIINFMEFEYKRWEVCKQYPEPMKYFLPALKEKKIENLGLKLVGIVDRVDRKFNGNYIVVEFKTAKFDTRSWKRTELRQEMAFYKLLVESSNLLPDGKIVEDFVVFYPRSNQVWTETFKTQTLNAFRNRLETVREGIEHKDFHCNVSVFCRYCEVRDYCPMSFERDIKH